MKQKHPLCLIGVLSVSLLTTAGCQSQTSSQPSPPSFPNRQTGGWTPGGTPPMNGPMAGGNQPGMPGGLRAGGTPSMPVPPAPEHDYYTLEKTAHNETLPFGVDNPFVKMGDIFNWNGEAGATLIRELGIGWAMPAPPFGINPQLMAGHSDASTPGAAGNRFPAGGPGMRPGPPGRMPPAGGRMGGRMPPMGGGRPGQGSTRPNPRTGASPAGEPDFSRHDAYVRYAQAQNLHILFNLGPRENSGFPPSPPAYPQDEEGYTKLITQTVERYDGDGRKDMPGLRYPIRYWMVLNEPFYERFWQGTAEEYLRVFLMSHRAIKQADPNAVVVLASLFTPYQEDTFEFAREFLKEYRQALKHKEAPTTLDAVDLHWISKKAADEGFEAYRDGWAWLVAEFDQMGVTIEERVCTEACMLTRERTELEADVVKRNLLARCLGIRKIFWSSLISANPEKDPFTAISLQTTRNDPVAKAYSVMVANVGSQHCTLTQPTNHQYEIRIGEDLLVTWATATIENPATYDSAMDLFGEPLQQPARLDTRPIYVPLTR